MLEFHFSLCVVREKNLTRRLHTTSLVVICLEQIGGVEGAHTAAAPVDNVNGREMCPESREALEPGIIVVPEEEIYHLHVTVRRDRVDLQPCPDHRRLRRH